MTANHTYKHFLAALLLALYAFIATPVQVWHSHTVTTHVTTNTADKNRHSVSAAAATLTEDNCAICAHKYATYDDDALAPIVSSLTVTTAKNGYYSLPFVSLRSFSLPNKGPPSLS